MRPAVADIARQQSHWVEPLSVRYRGRDVLGCIGLTNHPQGQVRMLVNTLDLGMNPQQAVDAVRFRVAMTTDDVQPDHMIPWQVAYELAARGHRFGDPTAFKGAAQMVRTHRGEAGVGPCLEAGVDHRLDGVALGW